MNKAVKWVLIIGALIFFVQSPGEAAALVGVVVSFGEQLVRAVALFVSQVAGNLTS